MTKLPVLFLLFPIPGFLLFAQIEDEKRKLREVLVQLEERYNISFTYADENVNDVSLIPPPEDMAVQEALEYLELCTGLKFKMLDDHFVTIGKPKEAHIKVCGYVGGEEMELAIYGATVQSKSASTITDEMGYFELNDAAPGDTIRIRFMGFESYMAVARDLVDCGKINLRRKTIKLQEVIIKNLITRGISVNSDGAVKIDAETLGILPGLTDPDVLHTLQALPGIQSVNETVSDINVRGGTNDQNIIFWDGIRMYQSGHFFGLISAFNPYLTKEVVLIKNGTTTALSEGVSSTIDIRKEDRVNPKFSGGAGMNMIYADAYLKIPVSKKLSLQLSGRRSISDIIQTPTYERFFERVFRNTDVITSEVSETDTTINTSDSFNFYDLTAKLLYDITANDKLRISFLDVHNSISYEEHSKSGNGSDSKTSGLKQASTALGMSYKRLWSDRITSTAKIYMSGYKLNAINHNNFYDQRLAQENKVLDMGIKLETRIAIHNELDLLSGYQFNETGITNLEDINNPPYKRRIKRVLRTHALFTEANYASNALGMNLRLGLRANYFEKFNRWIVEPRLAFNQKLRQHLSFEILGEMKNQTATQVIDLQNDFLGVEKRRWILANEDDVPIVTSRQLSAGIRYQSEKFIFSVDGYVKNVRGITSSSQGFQNQFQYIRSTGAYDVTGFEVLVNNRFGPLTSWMSYSYAKNLYEFQEFTPPDFPNNLDVRHVVTLGSSYRINGFQTSVGLNWRTGKPYTPPADVVDNQIVYDQPNSSNLDNYIRIDFSAIYKFNLSNNLFGELGISVWNLLDNDNIINIYYEIGDNGKTETIFEPALGFTPNMMVRVYF